ncbi:MAG: DUF2062 domain-containing protein [Rhodobacteraceae bacterium]|nr:DUF2062 domain-containing protein [Paracoccaceae bacterium]
MVFRRRDPRSVSQTITQMLYPRGGWLRAFHYVKHRVRRLPDSPQKIARGVAAGVFTAFTPFYGFHFVTAYILARLVRGNGLASMMATFFGNPLTYVPIAAASLQTGHLILGTNFDAGAGRSLGGKFIDAWRDLRDNFIALFTPEGPDWTRLVTFWQEVFFPYLVGGIVPGLICGVICYYLSVPVLIAYQNRRRARIVAKFEQIKQRAGAGALPPEGYGPADK